LGLGLIITALKEGLVADGRVQSLDEHAHLCEGFSVLFRFRLGFRVLLRSRLGLRVIFRVYGLGLRLIITALK
jgi:hypothetical protein